MAQNGTENISLYVGVFNYFFYCLHVHKAYPLLPRNVNVALDQKTFKYLQTGKNYT